MQKEVGRAVIAVVGAAALFVAAPLAAMADDITVVSWGGSYMDGQRKAFYEPFTAETGKVILEDEWSGEMGKIRAMVETGSYSAHVYDIETSHLLVGCDEGLWEPIDYEKLGIARDQFYPGAAHDCGVGNIAFSEVLAYDADQMSGEGPNSWADFWDVEKFPGKRGLFSKAKWVLEAAILADGVTVDKVYDVLRAPGGVDRAFAKLDEIKPHVVWLGAAAMAPQVLADKEVSMTLAANGRIYSAITKDGKTNFRIVWNEQLLDSDYWAIPKGHPQADLALEFIAFASRPDRMGEQASDLPYGPLRIAASKFVDPAILPHSPTAPENMKNTLRSDAQFWADNEEVLQERFNVWLAK